MSCSILLTLLSPNFSGMLNAMVVGVGRFLCGWGRVNGAVGVVVPEMEKLCGRTIKRL